MGGEGPVPGGGPGGQGGPPINLCDTPQCQAALAAVVDGKRQIVAQCAIVESVKTTLFILRTLAILMFVLAISLAVAAIGFFMALNILEGIVTAAAAAALFVAFLQFLPKLASTEQQYQTQLAVLNNDRSGFSAAVNDVKKNCSQACWGDLSIPACPD